MGSCMFGFYGVNTGSVIRSQEEFKLFYSVGSPMFLRIVCAIMRSVSVS